MTDNRSARGHHATLTRRRHTIRIRPHLRARLHGARTARLHVDDIRAVLLHRPGWLHPGWITLDLGTGHNRDPDDPCTITFPRRRHGEFVAFIAACRWPVDRA